MALSPKQRAWYWREWAAVRKVQPDADRHAIHARALGRDKSSKALTNRDFDRILQEFQAITQPDRLAPQLREAEQVRARLRWSIDHSIEALGLPYAVTVLRERFGTTNLDAMTDATLRDVAMTLDQRARALAPANDVETAPVDLSRREVRVDEPF